MSVLRQTWTAFQEDKASRLASAIAYAAIFSLAPLCIVLIAVIGWILGLQNGGHGHHLVEAALLDPIERSVGPAAAVSIRQMIVASFAHPRANLLAQVIGWVAFLVGASALFTSIQDALNAIWHVEVTKGSWRQTLLSRLATFGMLLIVGLLLLASLIGTFVIGTWGAQLAPYFPLVAHPTVTLIAGQTLTAATLLLVFAAIYKVLPDVDIAWGDVWIGAFVTTLLFLLGEVVVGLYIHFGGVSTSYGATGSLLVLLLWLYYSAMILLFGAEFTKVRTRQVTTTTRSLLRVLVERPAGVDPRSVSFTPESEE